MANSTQNFTESIDRFPLTVHLEHQTFFTIPLHLIQHCINNGYVIIEITSITWTGYVELREKYENVPKSLLTDKLRVYYNNENDENLISHHLVKPYELDLYNNLRRCYAEDGRSFIKVANVLNTHPHYPNELLISLQQNLAVKDSDLCISLNLQKPCS